MLDEDGTSLLLLIWGEHLFCKLCLAKLYYMLSEEDLQLIFLNQYGLIELQACLTILNVVLAILNFAKTRSGRQETRDLRTQLKQLLWWFECSLNEVVSEHIK